MPAPASGAGGGARTKEAEKAPPALAPGRAGLGRGAGSARSGRVQASTPEDKAWVAIGREDYEECVRIGRPAIRPLSKWLDSCSGRMEDEVGGIIAGAGRRAGPHRIAGSLAPPAELPRHVSALPAGPPGPVSGMEGLKSRLTTIPRRLREADRALTAVGDEESLASTTPYLQDRRKAVKAPPSRRRSGSGSRPP